MDALPERVIRVLAFIDQAEQGGFAPSPDAVNAFAAQPEPPQPYWGGYREPHFGPGADIAAWLIELNLATGHPFEVALTGLGKAMLRGAVVDNSTALVLDPKDPLSYAQLVARLSSNEPTLIADPYIRIEELHRLVSHTALTRILSSSKVEDSDRRGMAVLAANASRPIEVRFSSEESWHDRYVLRGTKVFQLGASVNGLNKNVTALLPVVDEAVAKPLREYVEGLWQGAQPLDTPDERLLP